MSSTLTKPAETKSRTSRLGRIVLLGGAVAGGTVAGAALLVGGLLLAVEVDVYDQNREWERIGASLLQEECGNIIPEDVNPVAGEEFVIGVAELPGAIERDGDELVVLSDGKPVCSTGNISELISFG